MSILSIFLILISASLHVGWNYLTKSSESPQVFSLLKGTVLMVIALGVSATVPLHEIPEDVWFYVAASGVAHMTYILSLSLAYEAGDISYVYPIARSAPAFVPLAAYLFLGDTVSLRGGIGILIVLVVIYVLQMRGNSAIELQQVWASLKKRDSHWAFATLVSVVTYTLIDKTGMVAFERVDAIVPALQAPLYLLLEGLLCYLLFWVYFSLRPRRELGSIWRREWSKVVLAALGSLASYSLILFVMPHENISYIVTLRQSSVLFAVLIGWLGLKEPYGTRRLTASLGMLLGFYLVATAR